MNIKCSQKWARPGMSSGSLRCPTLTSMAAAALSVLGSDTMMRSSVLEHDEAAQRERGQEGCTARGEQGRCAPVLAVVVLAAFELLCEVGVGGSVALWVDAGPCGTEVVECVAGLGDKGRRGVWTVVGVGDGHDGPAGCGGPEGSAEGRGAELGLQDGGCERTIRRRRGRASGDERASGGGAGDSRAGCCSSSECGRESQSLTEHPGGPTGTSSAGGRLTRTKEAVERRALWPANH